MESTLASAAQWAEEQFGGVELGDRRRTKRLKGVGAALAARPSGTLPAALPQGKDLKAAYRLLHMPEMKHAMVVEAHCRQTRQECNAAGVYLLIEDTTDLNYSHHPGTAALGWTGNEQERGFLLHSTLALRWSDTDGGRGQVVGLLAQRLWARHGPARGERNKKRQRQKRARESERWGAFLKEGGPQAGVEWVLVGDREADIAERILECQQEECCFVIRAAWPRSLEGDGRSLLEAAEQAPRRGEFEIALRARPGCKARTAQVEVRSQAVTVRGPERPGGRLPDFQVWVVCVHEMNPPEGVEPLHWVLLTDRNCESFEACRQVVRWYESRWLIEEYHKALKTGTQVEDSQLQTAAALEALIGILAVVAVRLLALKLEARFEPNEPLPRKVLGPETLEVLEAKQGRPPKGWTYRSTLVAIAMLGGFQGRKGDGDPGWRTLWRGWLRLSVLVEGYLLAQRRARGGQKCG